MTEQTGDRTEGAEADHAYGSDDSPDSSDFPDSPGSVRVTHDAERERFELRDGDEVIGVAAYTVVPGAGDEPDRVVLFHTEVRPEYEGQGLGGRLAAHALDSAVASARIVVALCPYIKAYVRHHPEAYAASLREPTRADVEAAERAGAG